MGWFGKKELKNVEILGKSRFTSVLLGDEKYSYNHTGRIKPLPQPVGAGFDFDPKHTLPVFTHSLSDHFNQDENGIIKCSIKERHCQYKNWKYNSEPLLDFFITEEGINLIESENAKGTHGIKIKR